MTKPSLLTYETVTLDRVFDVMRWRARRHRPQTTSFSFEFGGKRHFSVPVLGWPSIEPGTRLTVALRRPGNWQTLVGWVNHSNGEIVTPDTKREDAVVLLSGIVATLSVISFFLVEYTSWRIGTALFAFANGVVATMAYRNGKKKTAYIREITRVARSVLPEPHS